MGRIGDIGHSYAKIYSEVLQGYEPAYGEYKGWYSGALPDNIERWQMPVADSPVLNKMHYDNTAPLVDSLIRKRHKVRLNKSEWEVKQPKRAEGLQFKNAQDKPYVNMGEKPDADLVPMQLKDFSPEEQFKLSVTYPKLLNKTYQDNKRSDYIAEVTEKQTSPDMIDDLNHMDDMDFIKNGLGRDFVVKSSNNAIDVNGGVMVVDYKKDMNQPVGPRTAEDIYDNMTSNRTKPNFNTSQQDNYVSRKIIGAFSGEPNMGRRENIAPTNLSQMGAGSSQSEMIANAVVRQLMRENPMAQMKREDKLHKKKNKEQNKNIKLKEGEEYLKNLTHEQLLDIARSKQREKKAF